jgi:hypothetical protein
MRLQIVDLEDGLGWHEARLRPNLFGQLCAIQQVAPTIFL